MKSTKIGFLLFMVIAAFGCGKDKPETPDSGEIEYPVSFKLEDDFEKSEDVKYYQVGENNTYQEITVSEEFKSSYKNELDSAFASGMVDTELKKIILKSDTTVDVNFVIIDENTLLVELDTTFEASSSIDGEKVSVSLFGNSAFFFLDEQNENLRLAGSIYKGPYYFSYSSVDNLDQNFGSIADGVVGSLSLQDTFSVTFVNLVYKKE